MSINVYEIIEARDLVHTIRPEQFRQIKPHFADEFAEVIKDIVETDAKTIVIPDPDVDGMLSALMFIESLGILGCTKVEYYKQIYKKHGITKPLCYELIKGNYDYIIIVDSSSNELECLQLLVDSGVKVVVVDHHVCNHTKEEYPKELKIFNQRLDIASGLHVIYPDVSCGMLCALYLNYALSTMSVSYRDLWTYGAITLYSDGMNTQDRFNAMVITYVRTYLTIPEKLRNLTRVKYKGFNKDYVCFSIVPKINTCIRQERFSLIEEYLFETITRSRVTELVTEIEQLNATIKMYLEDYCTNTLDIKQQGVVKFAELTDFNKEFIRNYKGYLANNLSNTTCVGMTYYRIGERVYGSIRDSVNRDILSIFKRYGIKADGHPSAFGFEMSYSKLDSLIAHMDMCLLTINTGNKQPIYFDFDKISKEEMELCSLYNELATTNPILFTDMISSERYTIVNRKGYYQIQKDGKYFTSTKPITYNQPITVMPVLGKLKVV